MKKTPAQKQMEHLHDTVMYGSEYDMMSKEEVANHYSSLVHKMNDEISQFLEIILNIQSQVRLVNKHTYGIDEVMVYIGEIETQLGLAKVKN